MNESYATCIENECEQIEYRAELPYIKRNELIIKKMCLTHHVCSRSNKRRRECRRQDPNESDGDGGRLSRHFRPQRRGDGHESFAADGRQTEDADQHQADCTVAVCCRFDQHTSGYCFQIDSTACVVCYPLRFVSTIEMITVSINLAYSTYGITSRLSLYIL